MKLDGVVAIVTGGARGIGEGIARCLAAEGARVAILDLDGDAAAATAALLGADAMGFACDVAEETAAAEGVGRVIERYGRLDVLVNNAGGGRPSEPGEVRAVTGEALGGIMGHDQARWDEQLATNLRTTFVTTKAAMPHLRERGNSAIVNIASIAGLSGNTTITAYAAAKAGVISLTKSTALEMAPFGGRANAICPGFLWTRAWEGMAMAMRLRVPEFADLTPRQVFEQVVKNGVPLGREQTPEDIGKLAAFLCSDDARNITGQAIAVDGGITLR